MTRDCVGELRAERGWEVGHKLVSLEDFFGIDGNNLALTLLSPQSAQFV